MNLLRVAEWNATAKRYQQSAPDAETVPKDVVALRIKLLREEVDELEAAYAAGDTVEVLDALCDIQVVLNGGIAEVGMLNVFPDAMDAVCDSNDSKFILDPDGKTIPVLREGDGKIMKGHKYKPVDLRAVLDEHSADYSRQPLAYKESMVMRYIVRHLTEAWNLYVPIRGEGPSGAMFADGINKAKSVLASDAIKKYIPFLLP